MQERAWTEDCGDAHCIFALDTSGQRTQGGCRHLKDLTGTPMHVRGLVREAAAVVVSQRRELEAARAERDEKARMLEVIAESLGTDVLSILGAVRLLVGAVDALTGKFDAARAVVEKVPAVLRLDPGCDDHATGLDWCDRCHEAQVAHAELQHAYDAAKAGKAVE